MIYLDNGATSYPKPRGMVAAMEECIIKYCGNPGRSGHFMSMKTGEEVYHARRNVAKIFGIGRQNRFSEEYNGGIESWFNGGFKGR